MIGVSEETAERENCALAKPEEVSAQVLEDEDAPSPADQSMQHKSSIRFPIAVTWKGGEVEHYDGLPSLCSNLEDFSNWNDDEAKVVDADGQNLLLIISVTSPLTIMPMPDDVEGQTMVRWSDGRIVDHATLLSEADRSSTGCLLAVIAMAGGAAYLLS